MSFEDVAAERAVLAGILQYGRDAFVDADDLINDNCLSDEIHMHLWGCIKDIYDGGSSNKVDLPTLIATSRKLGIGHILEDPETKKYLRGLSSYPVELATVRAEAGRLLKLRVGKELAAIHKESASSLSKMTGSESLSQILAMSEQPLFNYVTTLNSEGHDTKQIGQGASEWLEDVLMNPRENIGIPTPYPKFNARLGGGIRRRGVSMLAARPKTGKTWVVDDIGLHVAGSLNTPVLNLDTEMSDDEHWARLLAHLSGISVEKIETGKVSKREADILRGHATYLKSIPYYYRSVIDESFEEQVAAMRRWVIKTVGISPEGVRNPCLILYDYLQLTDAQEFKGNNFKEYQILGFQMVALTRLAKKYDVPIFSLLQLNRDGIDKDSTAAASGSDRIIWKCFNFSIIRKKAWGEEDPGEGSHKLVTLMSRHGPPVDVKDYINLNFNTATGRISEGRTKFEVDKNRVASTEKGFAIEPDELS